MQKEKQLSQEQRYKIEALLTTSMTQTDIANSIGVHKSTICKELHRNTLWGTEDVREAYKANFAHHLACKRRQIRDYYTKRSYRVERRIIWLLRRDWSPEQISKTCKQEDVTMLSHEGIYLWLYDQKRKGVDYCKYLRRGHRSRRKRKNKQHSRQIIKNKTSIEERPEVVDQQKRAGDFEVDLVQCKKGYLLTATDRKTLLNLVGKVPDKSADTVREALVKLLSPYKKHLKTITSDNGLEFANHQQSSRRLEVDWYFAHPYSSHERGCNENQNGLLRQYAKRSTNLENVSWKTVKKWQAILNARPRKKLNFKSPKSQFPADCSTVAFAP